MPILFFLKEPPLTLAALGTLDDKTVARIVKSTRVVKAQAPDGKPLLISIDKESNIAYVKECSEDQLQKMKDEQKSKVDGKRIARPEFRIPTKRGGGKPS